MIFLEYEYMCLDSIGDSASEQHLVRPEIALEEIYINVTCQSLGEKPPALKFDKTARNISTQYAVQKLRNCLYE
jgi:hypothetical protein